ncbi:class I SAM-dependent methyltransferase [Costertonia aggregata]|uniref:Class I SAM-dependent methyltransferase n=1 Tax=Costertonia aggregata TaxID=343403 RepID=A0A7H9AP90_9FLAO|nr:class I SAM-dependent methyltransferase [Costertonia aggregata]QLG45268.1 class I SAM-dependent methyltransferase [Costertonia aggregata]
MKSFLKTKDFSVTGEPFELLYDAETDMLVTAPRPKNLSKYYESDTYISHTDSRNTLTDKLYQTVKRYNIKKKIKLVTSIDQDEKTLLDVGAGTGDFLLKAKMSGWQIAGVEPNAPARERASQKGIELHSDLSEISNKQFDVITLWHVLEHLPDLDEQIQKLESLLKKEGRLVVAVPNFKSHDAEFYGTFWAAYDVPRHLWHFSKNAIQKLFAKQKMILVETKPMIFDSFYVALLSEKYKTGKQNFLSAFWRGLISNISAWKSKEYSSHIYILKKG